MSERAGGVLSEVGFGWPDFHPRSAASALHRSLPFSLPTREQIGTLGLSHKFDKRRAASLLHCLYVNGLGPPV